MDDPELSSRLSSIIALAVTHKKASTITLSSIYLDEDSAYGELLQKYGEAFIFQTCNRVEIYVLDSKRRGTETILQVFHESSATVKSLGDFYSGLDAVNHLFRVASGLESAAIGESEVLGQLEKAFQAAINRRALHGELKFVVERAINVGKRIRSINPNLSRGAISLGSVAVDFLTRKGVSRDSLIGLVGAGAMASLIATKLRERGFSEVIIFNRALENARKLAEQLNYKYEPLDSLRNYLPRLSALITAIRVNKPILLKDDLTLLPPGSVVVDLGIPRNVEGPVVSIDELKKFMTMLNEERIKAIKDAERIIEAEITNFESLYKRKIVEMELSSFISRLDKLRLEEIERGRSRGLIDGDAGIDIVTKSILFKSMYPLVNYIKDIATNRSLTDAVKLIKEIEKYQEIQKYE
ncbi:MAG: hypothetical protein RXO22_03250 [Thermocladium sp.]